MRSNGTRGNTTSRGLPRQNREMETAGGNITDKIMNSLKAATELSVMKSTRKERNIPYWWNESINVKKEECVKSGNEDK
ncbi:hypothetical protein JTB14_027825 [Gonioctena quinquepunctata]|nr:hypothetical protein JTB14_027825 [Gonioctena quinquepunctata]